MRYLSTAQSTQNPKEQAELPIWVEQKHRKTKTRTGDRTKHAELPVNSVSVFHFSWQLMKTKFMFSEFVFIGSP
jgi:hypothetical protein